MFFLLNKDKVAWEVFDDFGDFYRNNPEKICTPDGSIEIIKATEEVIFRGSAVDAMHIWLEQGVCYSLLVDI